MKLLLDANLSPRVAHDLRSAAFDTTHECDVGLLTAPDDGIIDHAAAEGLVVVTADSDLGTLRALRRFTGPSVVRLRQVADPLHVQPNLAARSVPTASTDTRTTGFSSSAATRGARW